MAIHVSVLVFILLGSSVSARPTVEPFLGVPETITPAFVSDDGRTARQNHTVSNGETTMHLSYNVEHPDDVFILKLEQEESIVGVLCEDGRMELAFRDETSARKVTEQLAHGSLIVGHQHWGCADPTTGKPGVILRKVHTAKYSITNSSDGGGATMIIHHTKEASYRHLFKHADILFTTSAFPKDHFTQHARHSDAAPFKNHAAEEPSGRERQLGLTDFVTAAVSKFSSNIKSIASTVETMSQGVLKVTEMLVSNEYDVTRQKTLAGFAWNYNATQQTAIEKRITLAKGDWNFTVSEKPWIDEAHADIEAGLDCVNCFARGDLKLLMELKIHSHKLQIAEISTSGSIEMNLEGDLYGAADLSGSFEKEVHTITMNTITIHVYGVPILIDLTVPIHVGYEATLNAQGTLTVHAKGFGQMKYGVRYDSAADQKLELINEHDYGHSGGLDSMHMEASASLMLYALPTFILKVQKIGGPVVGIKPFLEFAVEGSYTSGSGSHGGSQIGGHGGRGDSGGSGGSSSVPAWQQQGSPEFCSLCQGTCPLPCLNCPHCSGRRLLRSESNGEDTLEGGAMNAVVQASNRDRRLYSTCAPNSISGAINWGVHVSIGAKIDIEFVGFHKESPQMGVTAIKKPLLSGCFDIGTGTGTRSGRELGPQPFPPRSLGSGEQLGMESWRHRNGQVYFGTLKYTGAGHKCTSMYGVQSVETTGYLSLQLINVVNSGTGDMFDMIGSLNYGHAQQGSTGNYACVFQKKYSYSGYEYQQFASLQPYQEDSSVDYKACTSGFAQSQDGYSCVIGNAHQLSCDDSMKCFHIELSPQGATTIPTVDFSSPQDSTTILPASATAIDENSCQHDDENSCEYRCDDECDEPDWCPYGTDTYDCTRATATSTMSPAVSKSCVDNEDIPDSNRWVTCWHSNMHKHRPYCQCDDCYQYDAYQQACVQCPSGSCYFIDDDRRL